jgi:translation initiation factor IF-3
LAKQNFSRGFAPRGPVQNPNRINEDIKNPQVRLVGDHFDKIAEKTGKQLEPGIYDTREVLAIAEEMELDLVEINEKAEPPICKIIDYNKFLYEKKKRDKEIKANAQKTVIKEVRFSPETHEHDFDFKLKHAEGFLKDGAKVKAYVMFKGRAIAFKERGEVLLLRFIQGLEDLGTPEAMPKLEGKRMFVFIAPKKKK